MDNLWFWNDIDDIYCTIAGFALIILGYLFTKFFWKWWKEVKNRKTSVSQSNALQGFSGGIVFFAVGLMLLYYSLVLPLLRWIKG
ncbi:hypothetical protein [Flavobacterium sp. KACC 22761]|uniref:hypothetical protein n=1 Tax=Flavobacterium sp. KACC 22761 TaxID=3092665 RepID=UPI002A74AFBE|nr:hypothetical protein [Flavobacterium sp. KACC 22761]WPO77195.1 hypothetical protein SCB73_13075 [Flavobacterium sp. KACC 22761]